MNHVPPPLPASAASGLSTLPDAMTIWVPPDTAILAASILVTMPPRDSSEPTSPAMASIAGVISRTSSSRRASALEPGGAV